MWDRLVKPPCAYRETELPKISHFFPRELFTPFTLPQLTLLGQCQEFFSVSSLKFCNKQQQHSQRLMGQHLFLLHWLEPGCLSLSFQSLTKCPCKKSLFILPLRLFYVPNGEVIFRIYQRIFFFSSIGMYSPWF